MQSPGRRALVNALVCCVSLGSGAAAAPRHSPDSRPGLPSTTTGATGAPTSTSSPPTTVAVTTSTSLVITPGAGRTAPKAAQAPTGSTLPPSGVTAKLTPIATANQPVGIVARPGDDGLFVLEKEGRVKVLRDGALAAQPVLDIRARVAADNERGLIGLAFAPDRPNLAYVNFTDRQGTINVVEFAFNGTTFDPASERTLVQIPKKFNEHNAGTLSFGSDGSLFIAVGDGGGSGDKFNNAQNKNSLLGKVLRIDPRPDAKTGKPYSIPPDNPFVGGSKLTVSTARPEIYAYGLRNPWRAIVDPASGDLWVPDVGESSFEEINWLPRARAGANLGWSLREGRQAFKGGKPAGAIDPVYDYPHKDGRCAVVGGFPYRGNALRGAAGWYVFGDVCSGAISALRREGNGWKPYGLGAKVTYLTAFGIDNSGELYAVSLEGPIYRMSA